MNSTVTPGKVWTSPEKLDYDKLNATALPSVSIDPQPLFFGRTTGTANALVCTLVPAATALSDGFQVQCVATLDNTGATTLNVSSLGGYSIKKGNGLALEAGDIRAGQLLTFLWDQTNSQWWLQSGIFNKAIATVTGVASGSTGTAYTVTASGWPAALATGQRLAFIADVANTGAVTLNVNGLGAKKIFQQGSTPLAAGMIGLGQFADVVYDATGDAGAGAWQLLSGTSAGISAIYCVGGGTANAHTGTVTPAPSSLSDGLRVVFKAIASNTGASTFRLNALGAAALIKKNVSQDLAANDIRAGAMVELFYDLTNLQWQLSTMVLAQPPVYQAGASVAGLDAYVVAVTPAPAALTEGMQVWFRPDVNNTGTATLNFCALGVKSILKRGGGALADNDILAATVIGVVYDAVLAAWCLIDTPITIPFIPSLTKMPPVLDGGTIAARGTTLWQVPHGLGSGVIPSVVQLRLVCSTAELGYSVNDEVSLNASDNVSGGTQTAYTLSADGTNVNLSVRSTGITILTKATPGVATAITPGSWKWKVYAWV